MKTLLFLLIFSNLTLPISLAQMGVNNDGSLPDASAQLDVKSSSKGLLLPRLFTTSSVISPIAGLMIYNQTTSTPYFYNGNNWADFTFTVPITATKTSNLDLIKLNQTGLGRGIYAKNGSSGVNVGIHSGYAVVGEGSTLGGIFGASNSGIGTTGISNANSGVYGKSTNGIGVNGYVGSSSSTFLPTKAGVVGEGFDSPGTAGFSNSAYGIYGSSESGEGVYGASKTASGVFGLSISNYGVQAYSVSGIGIYCQSDHNVGGDFKNISGERSGLVASKDVVYTAAYSNNPVADLEVRHFTNAAGNGMSGLRIYNANANGGAKAWTLYTAATGNLELYYNGNFYGSFSTGTGAYTGISDERRKENIFAIPSILSKVNSLSAKYYNYKTQTAKTVGFIAQEVEKIFPELVSTDGGKGDEYSVNYNGFGVLAVKAIQEQQIIIDDLKADMKTLLIRIEQLENKK